LLSNLSIPDFKHSIITYADMDNLLEKYILEHITEEDPVLKDLYRQTHLRFVNPNMVSGHLQGRLLEMISKMVQPKNVLEIGTFTGYSAICMARGLKPGGKVHTIESNDELSGFSRSYFGKAGLSSAIITYSGRAQDIIPGLDVTFDLAFIDGDKREYIEYYRLVFDKVKSGGFILVDNILWGGKVLMKSTTDPQTKGIIGFNEMIKNDHKIEKIIFPLRDGLMLIRKL
jgi:caffeoyl-CoA O-methyltransferase